MAKFRGQNVSGVVFNNAHLYEHNVQLRLLDIYDISGPIVVKILSKESAPFTNSNILEKIGGIDSPSPAVSHIAAMGSGSLIDSVFCINNALTAVYYQGAAPMVTRNQTTFNFLQDEVVQIF